MSPTAWISPAVIVLGPDFFTTIRFGPSPCMRMAMSLMLRTMSVTSSRTPEIDENSCSTPSICTDCTAAPCSDDSRMRRSALPSVRPKPRSSGSATTVASRRALLPADTCSLSGRISSWQFFWITLSTIASHLRDYQPPTPPSGSNGGGRRRFARPPDVCSDAPALTRAAAVVRDRRHVADRGDREARRLQRTQRRFAARSGSCHFHLEQPHAVVHRLAGGVLGRDLRGVRRRLARALEAHGAGRRPGDCIALDVGDGDHRVVEARVHVRDAGTDILAFATPNARGFLAHSRS